MLEVVREAWVPLAFFIVVAVVAVAAVLLHGADGRRRRRALVAIRSKYDLRDPWWLASMRGPPQLEGEVDGLHVRVNFSAMRTWTGGRHVTSFFVQVRVPPLAHAVVEPRASVGSKGPIGAWVEHRHTGGHEVSLARPNMQQTWRARGQDPEGLRRLLDHHGVARGMLHLHEELPNASIEWGLLRTHVDAWMDDPDEISAVLDHVVSRAKSLERAWQSITSPGPFDGPG